MRRFVKVQAADIHAPCVPIPTPVSPGSGSTGLRQMPECVGTFELSAQQTVPGSPWNAINVVVLRAPVKRPAEVWPEMD